MNHLPLTTDTTLISEDANPRSGVFLTTITEPRLGMKNLWRLHRRRRHRPTNLQQYSLPFIPPMCVSRPCRESRHGCFPYQRTHKSSPPAKYLLPKETTPGASPRAALDFLASKAGYFKTVSTAHLGVTAHNTIFTVIL